MFSLKWIGRIASSLCLLSILLAFVSIAQALLPLFGLTIPQTTGIAEVVKYVLLAMGAILLLAVGTATVIGYAVLSGWRNYKNVSPVLRLVLGVLVGLAVFGVASGLQPFLPIPFVSVIIVAFAVWLALRQISRKLEEAAVESMDIGAAERLGLEYLKVHQSDVADLETCSARLESGKWNLAYASPKKKKSWQVQLDAKTGTVTSSTLC